MPHCLIAMGSNLGDRRRTLDQGVASLAKTPGIDVIAVSRWHTYPAVGGPTGQQDFLNGVVRVATEISPYDLATTLHALEFAAGRERSVRWNARTLDCDLLLYGEQRVESADLQVPHPRLATRRFVLEPSVEVAADMVHPVSGWTIGRLLTHLETAPPYFAFVGADPAAVHDIAQDVALRVGARFLEDVASADGNSSSPLWERELESARRRGQLLDPHGEFALTDRMAGAGPLISAFWYWQSLLFPRAAFDAVLSRREADLRQLRPTLEPKLLIVVDASDSSLARRLDELDSSLRPPRLHLSADPGEARQDGAGAVMSMR